MSWIAVVNCDVVFTGGDGENEIRDGTIIIKDNVIHAVGPAVDLKNTIPDNCKVMDGRGCVVLPGLINCHHHLYQTLTRSMGSSPGLELFDWLKLNYNIWKEMDAECMFVSAWIGLVELVLAGATTVLDHTYIFPNGASLDDQIKAAQDVGVRFHATRGSMSLGQSDGGLPPDSCVEKVPNILEDCKRLVASYHDPSPLSMLRIGFGPCSPFSVTKELLQQSAELARTYDNVYLHTHLCETHDEEQFCLEQTGLRPLQYMHTVGWSGSDVSFAHMVHCNDDEIESIASSGSCVAHCPTSNMVLGSGHPRIIEMMEKGVTVGIGVDGSASNDGNHMLGELRQAMLLQRVRRVFPPSKMSARDAIRLGTRGGAKLLKREDTLGSLEVGKAADVIAFRVDDLSHAGGLSDPVGSLLTSWPSQVYTSIVNGKVLVEAGRLCDRLSDQLESFIARHNALSSEMIKKWKSNQQS